MKSGLRLAVLLFATTVPVGGRAADDHKGHTHAGKTGQAHPHDVKAQHGGIVSVIKDVNYELVAKPGEFTLYVSDHGKPADTTGGTGVITLLSGADKAEVVLAPAGGNKLHGKSPFKPVPGTKAVVRVALLGKAVEYVRFTMK